MENRRIPYPFFMTKEYEQMEREQQAMKIERGTYNGEKERLDRDYFKQMYPTEVKRYLKVIIEILDRLDVKNSFLYDEYPDKIRIDRLADMILNNIPIEKNQTRESQKNVIKLLLWEEIVRRRNASSQP